MRAIGTNGPVSLGKNPPAWGKNLTKTRCTDEFPAIISDARVGTPIAKPDRSMVPRDEIEAVLSRMRPLLQADGGNIELIDVSGRKAFVRLSGKCAGCPSSHLTLHVGIEMAIRDVLPDFEELVVV